MAEDSFQYEFEYSEVDPSEVLDSRGSKVTTVKCHGDLLAESRYRVEEMFRGTPFQGRIVIDLSDVNYIDSAGRGSLMRLKLHAVKESGVSVHFVQMTPRVLQLLKIAHLADWFSSQGSQA
jgi:anti-anti-sigma factor